MDSSRRRLGALAVSGVGAVLAVAHVRHGLSRQGDVVGLAFGVVPFLLLSLALVYVGYWVNRDESTGEHAIRIVGWGVGGGTLFAAVAALTVLFVEASGGSVSAVGVVVLDNVTAGALAGVLVGLYDAEGRNRRREVERQRDRVEDFARKAADVNNYGKLFNQSEAVEAVSSLSVEALGVLVGITESAFVLVSERELTVVDSTLPDAATGRYDDVILRAVDEREPVRSMPTEAEVEPVLAVPAILGETVIAVLVAQTTDVEFATEDVRLLEILASHAATALDNVRVGGAVDGPTNR